ncbi:phosphonate C-P lyase system protein PhnG [Dichotomicrobium thermohalophilum]|uniref:Alpha-D-ribose 1-methylphosphonate 5-triphosphate synthase subunit PhnG n=1 Tax=Dichotomicrobium thermohalophilum TaxID=933063 RepID=A0A397Q741_9HYPH|nr:phosphonate C-P lyase system protein PhnG [Dichotomicrobium thermohalophilum]RIA55615.1 alpha-D-ribose 1-methylphosphonate 5-triphosphate synthase subunit PhnG [Dichotomicrobium thermohalophilum]
MPEQEATAARQALMRICAQASEAELEQALDALAPLPEAEDIRAPEQGLVMLRGRIGGDGAPFNLGEATVTRATVRVAETLGHAYLLGRCEKKARLAAIVDALGQDAQWRARLEDALVTPVTTRRIAEQQAQAAETAKTRVNFFTLVRGEDDT